MPFDQHAIYAAGAISYLKYIWSYILAPLLGTLSLPAWRRGDAKKFTKIPPLLVASVLIW
jgi:F420-0:gamma-glutamyl ligase-like protein